MNDKIQIHGLAKVFVTRASHVVAIQNLSLTVQTGEFVCIVGPSGCGKTTLLRIIAGLERQSHGTVKIAQGDASKRVNSMIFQEQSIFPWMTVTNNVAFGLQARHVPRA